MIDLTKDTFNETIGSGERILVDYWATWCEPCKVMAPILAEINEEILPVYKVDVDAEMEIAKSQSIQSMPTLILYSNGEMVARISGARSKAKVIEDLNL